MNIYKQNRNPCIESYEALKVDRITIDNGADMMWHYLYSNEWHNLGISLLIFLAGNLWISAHGMQIMFNVKQLIDCSENEVNSCHS